MGLAGLFMRKKIVISIPLNSKKYMLSKIQFYIPLAIQIFK